MNHKLFVAITTLYFLSSCNSEGNNTEKSDTTSTKVKNESSVINCYQYASQDDTITLKLVHVGENITGGLVYRLKEKDRNMGTVQGFMRGDIFLADYTFMSEGVQSVRQVAFKKDGDGFVEGYGDVETKGDKVVFKNVDSLQFTGSTKLGEIACVKE